MGKKQNEYFDILQIFRGIASVMVVVYHITLSYKYFGALNNKYLFALGNYGLMGVDFFFVLSGFIISYSTFVKRTQYNNITQYKFYDYIVNRVLRIYIPYLPIGILMFGFYFLFPGVSEVSREINTIRSFTLFPVGNPALAVAWTLSYEMMFYILFGLCFISKRVWNIFLIIWASLIIFVNYISPINYGNIICFSTFNLEFILGYILAEIYIRKIKINKLIPIILSSLFFIIFCLLTFNKICFNKTFFKFDVNICFVVFVFFMVYYAINYIRKINFKGRKFIIAFLIGNASYSIYLVHDPIISIIDRLIPFTNNDFINISRFIFVLILSCIGGFLYYFIFEKFLLNKIRLLINKTKIIIKTKK